MPRGGKRDGAGRPPAFDEVDMFLIGEECERRLWLSFQERALRLSEQLMRKRADHQNILDRQGDLEHDDVHNGRQFDGNTESYARRLTDEQFVNTYEKHWQEPPEIEALVRRDVGKLLRDGRIAPETYDWHCERAREGHIIALSRAVSASVAGHAVNMPGILSDAFDDHANSIVERQRVFGDARQRYALPKGVGYMRGRVVHI